MSSTLGDVEPTPRTEIWKKKTIKSADSAPFWILFAVVFIAQGTTADEEDRERDKEHPLQSFSQMNSPHFLNLDCV